MTNIEINLKGVKSVPGFSGDDIRDLKDIYNLELSDDGFLIPRPGIKSIDNLGLFFDSIGAKDADPKAETSLYNTVSADKKIVVSNYKLTESIISRPNIISNRKRCYFLDKSDTHAEVRNGRLLLIAGKDGAYFIDQETLTRYHWRLDEPVFSASQINTYPEFELLRKKMHADYIANPNLNLYDGFPYSNANLETPTIYAWRLTYENPEIGLVGKASTIIYTELKSITEQALNWFFDENIRWQNTVYERRYKALLAAGIITSKEHDLIENQREQTRTFTLDPRNKPNWATHVGVYRAEIPDALITPERIEDDDITAVAAASISAGIIATGTVITATGAIGRPELLFTPDLGSIGIPELDFTVVNITSGATIALGATVVLAGIWGLLIASNQVEGYTIRYDIDIEALGELGDEYYKQYQLAEVESNDIEVNNEEAESEVYLDAFFKQSPPLQLGKITEHAGRIYGVDEKTQDIVFSHIDGNGINDYLSFPVQNRFNTTSSGVSPIEALEQMPSKGGIYVFKRDSIHYLEGQGIFTGLYDIEVSSFTDISAADYKKNIGCISADSIVNDGSVVIFVGSDDQIYMMAGKEAQPIGLDVKPYIEEMTLEEQGEISASWYNHRFYIALKDSTLILNTERKYWLRYDWNMSSFQWDRGGVPAKSTFIGLTKDGVVTELNKKNVQEEFPVMVETNKQVLPTQSKITGVYVYTDADEMVNLTVKANEPDRTVEKSFRPRLGNKYKQGLFAKGRHISTKIECEKPILIDRIVLEEQIHGT